MDLEGVVFDIDYPRDRISNQSESVDYVTLFGSGITDSTMLIDWLNNDGPKVLMGKSTIYAYVAWRKLNEHNRVSFTEYLKTVGTFRKKNNKKNDNDKAAPNVIHASAISRNLFSVYDWL